MALEIYKRCSFRVIGRWSLQMTKGQGLMTKRQATIGPVYSMSGQGSRFL